MQSTQLAPFQPQLPDAGPPDPFARFLDRSSIYYDSPRLDVAPSLSGFRSIAASCDWPDSLPFLLPQPLHYDYADAMPPPSSSHQLPSSDITQSIRNACANNTRAGSRTSKHEGAAARPREKKHGCWMCEKSFDRPSTLRKHLLVHTGEKAFVCDTCGRRFGVASNLNRHVKRCILKPVNAATVRPQMTPANTSPPVPAEPAILDSTSTSSSSVRSHKRTRDPGTTTPPDSPTQSNKPTKRRRRAPSPSQWIPQSLAEFNITPAEYTKPTPVPLPPVTAYKDPSSDEWVEERNSWDENVSVLPYHPCGWKGTLPGPGVGLGGKDVMNLGLVNGGTYVMGRLVMV